MPRKKTDTVEYFPHFAHPGRTMFVLEERYGNDGYAFWFKLLEVLATAEGHYFDFTDETSREYLCSRTRVDWETAVEILGLLVNLGQLDAELVDNCIIWCQGLVDNLERVYSKRRRALPTRPVFGPETDVSGTETPVVFGPEKAFSAQESHNGPHFRPSYGVSGPEIPQSKVEESKGDSLSSLSRGHVVSGPKTNPDVDAPPESGERPDRERETGPLALPESEPEPRELFTDLHLWKLQSHCQWSERDDELLAEDEQRLGRQTLNWAIRAFLKDKVPKVADYVHDKASYTYPVFHSQIPKLLEARPKGEAERPRCPYCKAQAIQHLPDPPEDVCAACRKVVSGPRKGELFHEGEARAPP